jgi:hypothetical protein
MSNYLAISAVTRILKFILEREIQLELDPIQLDISTKAPHAISSQQGESGLNIFLYQVTLNSGYANYDLPRRDARGRLISKPLVGLDLHYLLTPFSGDNDELLIQQILASAIRILHQNSVLNNKIIEEAFEAIRQLDSTDRILGSDISKQAEHIKIIHKPLSLDEITKIWSSHVQTNYRLSVTYLATVVLLDSKEEPIVSLPVQERKIFVKQLRNPIIEHIEPSVMQWKADSSNMIIQIIGRNLISDYLRVFIGEFEVPSGLISQISNEQISINLPGDLPAGIKTLKVIHGISDDDGNNDMADISEGLAFESNTSVFVLAPRIITSFPLQITRGDILNLEFKPPLKEKQKVEIMIGENKYPQLPISISNQTTAIDTIQINTLDFPLGRSLFRLRIDGAESFLEMGPDPQEPTVKKYIGPEIEVIQSI